MDKSFERSATMQQKTVSSKNLFSPFPVRWQYDGAVLPSELKIPMRCGLPEEILGSVFPAL
jgi:hypothetical protein